MPPGLPETGLAALVGAEPALASERALIQLLAAGFASATLLAFNGTPVDNQSATGLIVCRSPGRHEGDLLVG
jgi:hypothetical protein